MLLFPTSVRSKRALGNYGSKTVARQAVIWSFGSKRRRKSASTIRKGRPHCARN